MVVFVKKLDPRTKYPSLYIRVCLSHHIIDGLARDINITCGHLPIYIRMHRTTKERKVCAIAYSEKKSIKKKRSKRT